MMETPRNKIKINEKRKGDGENRKNMQRREMSCCNNYVVTVARKKSFAHSSRIFSRQLQQQHLHLRETTSPVDNNRFCLDYLSDFSYLIVDHLFVTTNNLTAGNILFVLMLINSISFCFIFLFQIVFLFFKSQTDARKHNLQQQSRNKKQSKSNKILIDYY